MDDETRMAFREIHERFDDLKESMAEGFYEMGKRFESVEVKIEALDERMSVMEKQMREIA